MAVWNSITELIAKGAVKQSAAFKFKAVRGIFCGDTNGKVQLDYASDYAKETCLFCDRTTVYEANAGRGIIHASIRCCESEVCIEKAKKQAQFAVQNYDKDYEDLPIEDVVREKKKSQVMDELDRIQQESKKEEVWMISWG